MESCKEKNRKYGRNISVNGVKTPGQNSGGLKMAAKDS